MRPFIVILLSRNHQKVLNAVESLLLIFAGLRQPETSSATRSGLRSILGREIIRSRSSSWKTLKLSGRIAVEELFAVNYFSFPEKQKSSLRGSSKIQVNFRWKLANPSHVLSRISLPRGSSLSTSRWYFTDRSFMLIFQILYWDLCHVPCKLSVPFRYSMICGQIVVRKQQSNKDRLFT